MGDDAEHARTTFTDLVAEKAGEFNRRFDPPAVRAKELRDAGELRLVDEFVMEPYRGHGFRLGKGQVVRYELIVGPQILDTVYLVADRPTGEWADIYATAQYGALTLSRGCTTTPTPPTCGRC